MPVTVTDAVDIPPVLEAKDTVVSVELVCWS
jgi:hypothetical protein